MNVPPESERCPLPFEGETVSDFAKRQQIGLEAAFLVARAGWRQAGQVLEHRLESGQVVWFYVGLGLRVVSSPVVSERVHARVSAREARAILKRVGG